jgi:hypothetical protein
LRYKDLPAVRNRSPQRLVRGVQLSKPICRNDESSACDLHDDTVKRQAVVDRFVGSDDPVVTDHPGLDHVAFGQFDHERHDAVQGKIDGSKPLHRFGQRLALRQFDVAGA